MNRSSSAPPNLEVGLGRRMRKLLLELRFELLLKFRFEPLLEPDLELLEFSRSRPTLRSPPLPSPPLPSPPRSLPAVPEVGSVGTSRLRPVDTCRTSSTVMPAGTSGRVLRILLVDDPRARHLRQPPSVRASTASTALASVWLCRVRCLTRRGIGPSSSEAVVRLGWVPSDLQICRPDPFQPLAIEIEHAHGRSAHGCHAHDLEPIGRPGEVVVPPADARAEQLVLAARVGIDPRAMIPLSPIACEASEGEVLDRARPSRRDRYQVLHRELDVLPLLRRVAVLATMTCSDPDGLLYLRRELMAPGQSPPLHPLASSS